jgi:hypothetical protein
MRTRPTAIQHASEPQRANKSFMMQAIRINAFSICFASPELKKNKTLGIKAVSKAGSMLRCLDPSLQDDDDIVF